MRVSREEALQSLQSLISNDVEQDKYNDCMSIVRYALSHIEENIDAKINNMIQKIPRINQLSNRTYYVGKLSKFPKGCISCLCGDGLNSIRKTNKCNLNCKFCYYYGHNEEQPEIPDGMWQIGGKNFAEKDIEKLIRIQGRPTGVCYAYLEPFLEIEKYYNVINIFNQNKIYQHLYTNGVRVTENALRRLGNAGLNELRFNLGATNCDPAIIEKIYLAKKYIPSVGIETPMTPDFFNAFLRNKKYILATGLDFINCAELHLNPNNIDNYSGEKLYMCRNGYISPVWSRQITMEMMKTASNEEWDFVVHDCSNMTKYCRELNYGKRMKLWFGANYYDSEFDNIPYKAFLPILSDDEYWTSVN